MKDHSTAQRGSVVLVALCLTVVLGVVVIGYVAVCARTMEMSNRSFCTTSSVQLAEIGMEEALWSLDQALLALNNNLSFDWGFPAPPGAGWTVTTDANGVKTATKTLPPFTTNKGITGTVTVQIKNCSYDPRRPYVLTDQTTWPPTITSDGVSQMPDGIPIDKQLVATVKPAALFSNAAGSTGLSDSSYDVSFTNTPGGTVDSYDSSSSHNLGNYTPYYPPGDPLYDPFYDPLLHPENVNRSDLAIISAAHLHINKAVILGYATTANSTDNGPSIDTSGSVTSLTSSGATSATRIDYSRISNNANQYAFDIVAPTTASSSGLPDGGTLHPTDAGLFPSGYYSTTGNWVQPPASILTITGPAIIFASSDFDIEGSIIIAPTSPGPVQIYVGGKLTIAGNGIDNQTKQPRKLAIFCTGTQGTINTNTPFYGAVYAPNSPLVVNSDLTVYGALVGQSVTFTGTPTIHYDLDLRNASFGVVNTPYDVSQWLVSN